MLTGRNILLAVLGLLVLSFVLVVLIVYAGDTDTAEPEQLGVSIITEAMPA